MSEIVNSTHEAILQGLDREIYNPRYGYIFLPEQSFLPTVSQWEGVPVIYGESHPSLEAFDNDPGAELERINGKVVGKVSNARIDRTGHSKLMSSLDIEDGQGDYGNINREIELKIKAGKLSLSTVFYGNIDEDWSVNGPVKPHHVLIFEEIPGDPEAQPVDKMAVILNGPANLPANPYPKLAEKHHELKELLNKYKITSQARSNNAKQISGNENMDEKELTNKVTELEASNMKLSAEIKNQESDMEAKDEEMAKLKEEMAAKDAKIAELEAALKEFQDKEVENNWNEVKNMVPKGMLVDE